MIVQLLFIFVKSYAIFDIVSSCISKMCCICVTEFIIKPIIKLITQKKFQPFTNYFHFQKTNFNPITNYTDQLPITRKTN